MACFSSRSFDRELGSHPLLVSCGCLFLWTGRVVLNSGGLRYTGSSGSTPERIKSLQVTLIITIVSISAQQCLTVPKTVSY